MESTSLVTLASGLLAGLGIGSVTTALMQHYLQKKTTAFESQREDLEKRYKVVILLMYAASNFEANSASLRINRPDLKSQRDIMEELKAEWYNMLLFASSSTQHSLHSFICSPTLQNLKNTAVSMRIDLGRTPIGDTVHCLEFDS